MSSGDGLRFAFCNTCATVELDAVYRSKDPEHLLFLNRIRLAQPTRNRTWDYFEGRHWDTSRRACDDRVELVEAVRRGMVTARDVGEPFQWLT